MKLRAAIHPEMHYEINLHALTCDLVHVTPFFVMFVVTVEPFPLVEGGGGNIYGDIILWLPWLPHCILYSYDNYFFFYGSIILE